MRVNGVSNITDKIINEAKAWSEAQIAEGKAESDAIRQEFADTAAVQGREVISAAEARAAAILERAKSQADMDHRKRILSTRQTAVGRSFDMALQALTQMPQEDRALLMVRLAVQHQTGDAELIFSAADQALVGPLVVETVNAVYKRQQIKETFSGSVLEQLKKLISPHPVKHSVTLSPTVGGFVGGFIIKEGDIEKNCTFEVLLGAVRDELEGDVSSILFK